MRSYTHISPSALAKWESDRETFYMQYLCETRTARMPQENFMASGSAFDAFVKSSIHKAIHGEAANKGSQFDFQNIFESQVEPHIRDEILPLADDLFQQYVHSGAYGALLGEIQRSPYAPQMEFTVKGEIDGIPLLGKPDLRYVTKDHVHVICDWKVNGSCSKYGASPTPGYKICRDSYGSNTHNKKHKKYEPQQFKSLEINKRYLNEFSTDWADQLAIYSWLLGEPVGSEDFVIQMEQVACRPVQHRDFPRAKFATHMSRIDDIYQNSIMQRLRACWESIQSGHIFTDLSREESDERCEILDQKAQTPKSLHPVLAGYSDERTRFKPFKKDN